MCPNEVSKVTEEEANLQLALNIGRTAYWDHWESL